MGREWWKSVSFMKRGSFFSYVLGLSGVFSLLYITFKDNSRRREGGGHHFKFRQLW